jgi:hypothetical protein
LSGRINVSLASQTWLGAREEEGSERATGSESGGKPACTPKIIGKGTLRMLVQEGCKPETDLIGLNES